MRLDAFIPPRRLRGAAVAALAVILTTVVGAALVFLHHSPGNSEAVAVAHSAPPVDPVETGSVPETDAIGKMLEKLGRDPDHPH